MINEARDNPIYPIEDVGLGPMELSIRFVPPETFGFDPSVFEENGVIGVTCSIVGVRFFGVTINHTRMCHSFRKTDNGLELRSRFWMGTKLTPALRKAIIKEKTAMGMMTHCSKEFNHLASILPDVYTEFSVSDQ